MNFLSLFSLHFPNPNIGTCSWCAPRRKSVKSKRKRALEWTGSRRTQRLKGRNANFTSSSAGTSWRFFSFGFIYLFFLSVLFSQYCNASLDITQASLSCSASAESNLGPRCNCQADKTFLLWFTLKRSFPPCI